jgi:hypothetical protein
MKCNLLAKLRNLELYLEGYWPEETVAAYWMRPFAATGANLEPIKK